MSQVLNELGGTPSTIERGGTSFEIELRNPPYQSHHALCFITPHDSHPSSVDQQCVFVHRGTWEFPIAGPQDVQLIEDLRVDEDSLLGIPIR